MRRKQFGKNVEAKGIRKTNVVNLSIQTLDIATHNILELGLNFAVMFKKARDLPMNSSGGYNLSC
jgi:hypothetical protein